MNSREQRLRVPAARLHRRHVNGAVPGALAALSLALVGACSSTNAPARFELFPSANNRATAPLASKNGSAVSGRVSFVQRGQSVTVFATIFDLTPGTHSIYIHDVGNCSSLNAASAGPVWNVAGAGRGGKARSGDMPELQANAEGRATLSAELRGLSVGTGSINDVVGHSVVIHEGYLVDPKAEFGVPNERVGCGVIEAEKASS